MQKAEQRFGGDTQVKLDPIKEILVAKMMADARDLIALLSTAETMGQYEQQQQLLEHFQAAHRAIHVLNGVLDPTGATVLQMPPTVPNGKSLPKVTDLASALGGMAVSQALELGGDNPDADAADLERLNRNRRDTVARATD